MKNFGKEDYRAINNALISLKAFIESPKTGLDLKQINLYTKELNNTRNSLKKLASQVGWDKE